MSSVWKSCCAGISQKWTFTILSTIGVFIGNIVRVLIAITIVEMTLPTNESKSESNQGDSTCGDINNTLLNTNLSTTSIRDEIASGKRYDWDEYTQGIILSAYFWGYTFAQPLYGPLSERWGGKYLLGFGIFIPSVITLLTPLLTGLGGSTALIITRVLMGALSAAMYPVTSSMIPKWTTETDRTKVANTILAGPLLGLFIGTMIPGVVIKYSGTGWPGVFYLFGTVGIIWFPAWVFFVYNSPEEHPFISQEELKYLRPNTGTNKTESDRPATPWKHIFLCKEFWAFTISLIGNNWAYFAMISDLPKYMSSVVKFSIDSNSYFSALPYLFTCLNGIFSSWVNDKILEKKWMSVTNVRKLMATLGLTGPAVFILLASFAECNRALVVAMFMIGITSMGSLNPSVMMSPLDLSPNYAGSVMAVGNSIASVVGIIVPYTVGAITPNQTIGEWRLVFWIVFFFSVASNAIYLLWFTAEVKDWDDPNFDRNGKEKSTDEREAEMKMLPQ